MSTVVYPLSGRSPRDWRPSSLMGWRKHPVTGKRSHHNGTDIVASSPDAHIRSFAAGKVIKAGYSATGFGNYVVIRHRIGRRHFTSLYAHMAKNSVTVRVGSRVVAGSVIGKIGTTGMSTGVHLHFEIKRGKSHLWNGVGLGYVEPLAFIRNEMKKESANVEK